MFACESWVGFLQNSSFPVPTHHTIISIWNKCLIYVFTCLSVQHLEDLPWFSRPSRKVEPILGRPSQHLDDDSLKTQFKVITMILYTCACITFGTYGISIVSRNVSTNVQTPKVWFRPLYHNDNAMTSLKLIQLLEIKEMWACSSTD